MKLKSSVIENQNVSVNWDLDLVHTARHAKKIVIIRKIIIKIIFLKNKLLVK